MVTAILFLIILGPIVLTLFIAACFYHASNGSYQPRSAEDKVVDEMRRQRNLDYFNNPVVNEMKRESFFRKDK